MSFLVQKFIKVAKFNFNYYLILFGLNTIFPFGILAGKFALEGFFRKIVVRSIKCYYLEGWEPTAKPMIRMKGQKRSCQSLLNEKDFREPNPKKLKYGSDWCMRPTANLEIIIKRESRQFLKSINLKRRCEVRNV